MSKSFQLLITTVNKSFEEVRKLVEMMNVSSDAIVRCQTDFDEERSFCFNKKTIFVIFANDKGLSKNRNELLKKSTADYVMFADDDERFVDNYENMILTSVENYDCVDFSFVNDNNELFSFSNRTTKKRRFSSKIGIISMVFKRLSLINSGILFDERFGAGAEYDRGEDTIFRKRIFDSDLSYKSLSTVIFDLYSLKRESYCADRFDNRGIKSACVFYGYFYGFISCLFIFRLALKSRKTRSYSLREMFRFRKEGMNLRRN